MPDCHDEHHGHDHDDHDHDAPDAGPRDNLFSQIDRDNVVALNALGPAKVVIKPWHERMDEVQFLESDADDQIILRIPFTSSVKLRALLLKCGPAEHTPASVRLFPNADGVDFDDVAERAAAQEMLVVQGREVGEYALRTPKFTNLSSLTLLFPAAQGADTCRIYYVGFLGTWVEHIAAPPITVYETQANLADHEKVQGTDGGLQRASQGY
ncbi:galactose-binding domain-like protein [Mycena rebaudengoi]|nr:galactose-binding domain-like protein [Mycena rebaudengoi]